MIGRRLERAGAFPEHFLVEYLVQAMQCRVVSPHANRPRWFGALVAAIDSVLSLMRFTKEFAPLVTSGPPGVTGYATGRPPVREVFAFWPALVRKELVSAGVHMMES